MKSKGVVMVNSSELAERWGLSPRTLANWRSQKKGPRYIKLGTETGSHVVYKLDDVIKYEKKFYILTEG